MTYLNTRLPVLHNVDSSMWVDEAIWGHMLYDEQTPWLIYLEFLNVFLDQYSKGCALSEVDGLNRLKYRATWRLELRNILFNNPKIRQIKASNTNDQARWREWHKSMERAGGIDIPDFTYLEQRFHSFDDFADLVELLRSTGIESTTNKRWTSKYVFPYGKDCIFEDLDQNARSNDRHFFRRTGELLYLMLCRSSYKEELLTALLPHTIEKDSVWNKMVALLQPNNAHQRGADYANTYLPYLAHPVYDKISQDWLSILKLEMPGYDALPHIVNLAAFHLIQYQLQVARDIAGATSPFKMVCEVVASRKTLVREISCDVYQENNLLSTKAVTAYIEAIERSEEWQHAKDQHGAFEICKQILDKNVRWEDQYQGSNNPDDLIAALKLAAKKRHQQHAAHVHRSYGREIGLVSKRGAVKLRYAPNDDFLKALIFSNVPRPIELNEFLKLMWSRYSLILGDREAEEVLSLSRDEFDKKAFQANSRRLEQRLASLGLLKRLSDGCAYVLNPYARSYK